MNPAPPHYADWFRAQRHRLAAHGLALDGGEPGRPDPAEFATAKLRVLFCRLSPYVDVTHSITHRLLAWAARQVPGVYVDFAFFPPAGDAALLEHARVPFWLASGCKRPPHEFDVLAISISVPQEALNLPAALHSSGLELGSTARLADPRHPLLLLGGNAAGSVAFIHGDAAGAGSGGLVDAVCNGDGVLWFQEFLRALLAARAAALGKREFLTRCAVDFPGTYVPWLYRHEYRAGGLSAIVAAGSDPVPLPVAYRADPHECWLDGYDGSFIPFADEELEETLPLTTGCRYRCRFCQSGWIPGALRLSPPAPLLRAARRLRAATAASDLNLLASDACSVDTLASLVPQLAQVFPHVSVKSLALASLALSPDLLGVLAAAEKHEFTFGIEGVSARLRAYLGKPLDAAALDSLLRRIAAGGLRQLKLFFIATGLETDADAHEFGSLLRRVAQSTGGGRVVASITPLFAAPFTPLQFGALRAAERGCLHRLETAAVAAHVEFRWSCAPTEIRLVSLLCRAGRAATPCLVALAIQHRVRYGDGLPATALPIAEKLLANAGISAARLSAEVGEHDCLPWDDLGSGAERPVLWGSYARARDELAAAAPVPVAKAVRPVPSPLASAAARRAAVAPPPAERTVQFQVWLEPDDAWRPQATLTRALLRAYFAANEELACACLDTGRLCSPSGFAGLSLLTVRFRAGAVLPPVAGMAITDWHAPRALVAGPVPAADSPTEDPDALLFAVLLTGAAAAGVRPLLEHLKSARIHFQSVRRETGLWSVLAPTYRARTGIWAIGAPDAGTAAPAQLICTAQAMRFLGRDAARLLPGPLAFSLLIRANESCAKCGGVQLRDLLSLSSPSVPTCIGCLC